MADKSAAVGEMDAGYARFREKIADLPDSAYSERWLGDWDLSQLLAHMVGWYGEMTGACDRAARGERPTPEGVDYSDSDAWNAKFASNAKPGKTALAAWDAAYGRYKAAAQALPDNLYGTDPERGRPLIGNRLLQGAGIGHFEEHQGQLEEWLGSRK
jgi:hypothetical protein